MPECTNTYKGTDKCIHGYMMVHVYICGMFNDFHYFLFKMIYFGFQHTCILIMPRRRRDDNAIKDQLREAGGVVP